MSAHPLQGLLLDDLQAIAPGDLRAESETPWHVDCWEYEDYEQAAEATGRKKLIMAGLTNDVCIVYPAIRASPTYLSKTLSK
jgi:hypothetical protein